MDKMLETSISSVSHNVFYSMDDKVQPFINSFSLSKSKIFSLVKI